MCDRLKTVADSYIGRCCTSQETLSLVLACRAARAWPAVLARCCRPCRQYCFCASAGIKQELLIVVQPQAQTTRVILTCQLRQGTPNCKVSHTRPRCCLEPAARLRSAMPCSTWPDNTCSPWPNSDTFLLISDTCLTFLGCMLADQQSAMCESECIPEDPQVVSNSTHN